MTDGPRRVLVLGGTGEASVLARALHARGHEVTLSLLGLTKAGQQPFPVRTGGFGGVRGLMDELRRADYQLLINASHPFANKLSHHAFAAAGVLGIPHLRLLRPPWVATPADRWYEVATLDDASGRVARLQPQPQRVFLSVGRFGAKAFAALHTIHFIVRAIATDETVPIPGATVIEGRGPYTIDGESQLLRDHHIDLVVTRNSGGSATAAKLTAAQQLGLPVLMVRRPQDPPGEQAQDVAEALAWAEER